jgi:HEPN domain-containing protein
MTRTEFQRLARMRLRDARVLLQNGNNEGAYYLIGLAVECGLKSAIARKTQRHDGSVLIEIRTPPTRFPSQADDCLWNVRARFE